MRVTQPDQVLEIGWASVFPVNDVMRLAPPRSVTPGKATGDVPVLNET